MRVHAQTASEHKETQNRTPNKGRVIAPVVVAFAEMSPDTYAIASLISSVLANEHCSFFADKALGRKKVLTENKPT